MGATCTRVRKHPIGLQPCRTTSLRLTSAAASLTIEHFPGRRFRCRPRHFLEIGTLSSFRVKMQRAVIFDLDGVLVDSYQAHFDSWQRLCRQWDLTMTERQFAATFGRTTREVVAQFWSSRAFTAAEVAELDGQKEAIYRELLQSDFPIMDGVSMTIGGKEHRPYGSRRSGPVPWAGCHS